MHLKTFSAATMMIFALGMTSQALGQQSNPSPQFNAPGPSATAKQKESAPFQGQILTQPNGTHFATDLIGADVDAKDRSKVGKVEDLIYKPDGSIDGLVVGVGGFLGIGAHQVAIKLQDAKISSLSGNEVVRVPVTAAELAKAPTFKTAAKVEREKKIELQREQQKQSPNQPRQM